MQQDSETSKRPSGKVTSGNVMKLLEWQSFRCAITGRELTPATASLDHIVPVSRGGLHTLDNVQVVHADINAMKRTMLMSEFIAACAEVVTHLR